jgi:hypothetical protein
MPANPTTAGTTEDERVAASIDAQVRQLVAEGDLLYVAAYRLGQQSVAAPEPARGGETDGLVRRVVAAVATVCPETETWCRIASVGNGWACMDCEREMERVSEDGFIAAVRALAAAPGDAAGGRETDDGGARSTYFVGQDRVVPDSADAWIDSSRQRAAVARDKMDEIAALIMATDEYSPRDVLLSAASDLRHIAGGGACHPDTLRAHAALLAALARAPQDAGREVAYVESMWAVVNLHDRSESERLLTLREILLAVRESRAHSAPVAGPVGEDTKYCAQCYLNGAGTFPMIGDRCSNARCVMHAYLAARLAPDASAGGRDG